LGTSFSSQLIALVLTTKEQPNSVLLCINTTGSSAVVEILHDALFHVKMLLSYL